jgi:hypothetical protein
VGPWLIVLFLGVAILGAWFLIGPLLGPGPYYRSALNRTTYGFSRQILALFVPYAIALWAWHRGSRISVPFLLGGAVALHLILLFAPLPQSQDFYQYLFYGRMQAAYQANPYVVHPSVYWLDGWYGMITWPNQTSVYGPVWTLLSFGVAKAAGPNLPLAVVYMKLAVFAMDLAIIWSILTLSKDRPDPKAAAGWGLLAYAWNPLILMAVPLGGLADVAIASGIVGAIVARRRGKTWLTTVLLTAAALVKIYAGVALLLHLVLLFRSRRKEAWLHGALATAVTAITFAPYWAGLQTFRGILKIADHSNKSLTGTIQRVLVMIFRFIGVSAARDDAAAVVRWFIFPILLLAVLWAVARVESERDVWFGTLALLTLYVLITPWYLYWYLVTPVALIAVLPRNRLTAPILTFTGTTFVVIQFPPWLAGMVVQAVARYTPPLLVYRHEMRKDRARRSGSTAGGGRMVPYRVGSAELGRFVPLV